MRRYTLYGLIFIVALVLILVCIFAGKGNTGENNVVINTNENKIVEQIEPVTVKVSEVTRSVFYAPQYVAIKNEYFKSKGIDIELTTGQGADNVMTAVLSNQVDIGFAGPEASIYVYNEGKEDYPQVFAQLTQTDGSFLVSKEPTDNFQWSDLKGKTVIPGRKGGVPYMTLEYVLKKNGINPETDLTLDDSIKFDLMAGAFTGGEAEYVTLFEPTASLIEQAGKGYIVASVGEAAGKIPYTAYFAKQSYMKENEQLLQDFTDAIYEGQTFVKNHTAREIAQVVQEFFPDTDLDTLETAIQSYKDIDAWKTDPVLQQEDFDLLQTIIDEAGELDKKAPYENVVNTKYAKNVKK